MKYQLQMGRGGEDWRDVDDYPRDQTDLAAWIEIGNGSETHGGKYHYRIVDENGQTVWTAVPPYDSPHLNLAEPGRAWLDGIRQGYGLSADQFKTACRDWLEAHPDA